MNSHMPINESQPLVTLCQSRFLYSLLPAFVCVFCLLEYFRANPKHYILSSIRF